jgi:alpha-tubulin suppressor-like RCC1 family protein
VEQHSLLTTLAISGTAPLTGVTQAACGANHTIALLSDGTVATWGANGRGQLGDNSATERHRPGLVLSGAGGSLGGVASALAGDSFSLALLSSGGVVAWGRGTDGELGNAATIDQKLPVQVNAVGGVGSLSNAVSIATGRYHGLALLSDGTVAAWGLNGSGQLGDNTTVQRSTPISVIGLGGSGTLQNVVAVAGGANHSLALLSDGTVAAWGMNTNGQLGDFSTTQRRTPVLVAGIGGTGNLQNVVAISAAASHSLALLSDGTMVAWGLNTNGQLGNNSLIQSNTPVKVVGLTGTGSLGGIVGLAAGRLHSLALGADGSVYAWGLDQNGQLGDNSSTQRQVPARMLGVGGAGTIANVSQVCSGCQSDFSAVLVSSYQAVDLAVGGDSRGRVLFAAPGATTNGVRIDQLSLNGATATAVAIFDPPSGAAVARRLLRGFDGNLYVLFTDSATAPTHFALAVVPENGGTVVRSAATALSGTPLSVAQDGSFNSYLCYRAGGIGSAAVVAPLGAITEGAQVTLGGATTLTNPVASPTTGDLPMDVALGGSGVVRVLYATCPTGTPNGWVVASHPNAATAPADAVSAPQSSLGLPLRLSVDASGNAVVLSSSGSLGASRWNCSTVTPGGGDGVAIGTSHAAQNCAAGLGQLQALSIAVSPASPNEPRLLLGNDLPWLRRHLAMGTIVVSRRGSGRVWTLSGATNNPTYASLPFRD